MQDVGTAVLRYIRDRRAVARLLLHHEVQGHLGNQICRRCCRMMYNSRDAPVEMRLLQCPCYKASAGDAARIERAACDARRKYMPVTAHLRTVTAAFCACRWYARDAAVTVRSLNACRDAAVVMHSVVVWPRLVPQA